MTTPYLSFVPSHSLPTIVSAVIDTIYTRCGTALFSSRRRALAPNSNCNWINKSTSRRWINKLFLLKSLIRVYHLHFYSICNTIYGNAIHSLRVLDSFNSTTFLSIAIAREIARQSPPPSSIVCRYADLSVSVSALQHPIHRFISFWFLFANKNLNLNWSQTETRLNNKCNLWWRQRHFQTR